ncbi:MAG: MmgE/PrpD family protein [Alphaproteobacteria bacterium]|nr:MmgE/PrpD family protein [Alphaproteobacteria bacterium]
MGAARQPPVARRVAELAVRLDYDDIPAAVVEAAKLHLLDTLGVGLAAAATAVRPRIEDAVRTLGQSDDSTGLGLAERLPAASAALLNGALMHALEFDDTHIASVAHGSAVVMPAALALAEREGASGRDLLRAIALGWELLIRLGLAAPNGVQAHGFQLTAVGGPFAAALAAAALLRLDADVTTSALGIAGSQAAGVFEFLENGSTAKHIHGGWPAHAGIVAAELARAGMTGPETIFEGRRGFYRAYAGASDPGAGLAELTGTLGSAWHLPEAAIKPYPCCHYIQPFLEGLEQVLAQGVATGDIAEIHCRVPTEQAALVCEPWEAKIAPATAYQAKWSLPYCLAALLADGRLDIATFDRSAPEERLVPLARKIRFEAYAGSGFPERYSGAVEVATHDGRRCSAEIRDVRGSPAKPLGEGEVRAKFLANARRTLTPEAAETVMIETMRLDSAASLRPLGDALRTLRR